ncbi:Hypothetical protein LOCK900_0894 [Lacticaseibacillus rhamnosus LOCK900]|nr:Hypothetical protein LOCK900_0894 [Lacticaseibacillus rhamnosus LOCK900]EHJ30099.1 hypothetical protein HMPREF0541_01721 [Lacticaseibacillus rhamnosus ATCC 21052]
MKQKLSNFVASNIPDIVENNRQSLPCVSKVALTKCVALCP